MARFVRSFILIASASVQQLADERVKIRHEQSMPLIAKRAQ